MSVANWNNPGRPSYVGPVITDRASRYAPIPEPGPIRSWRDKANCSGADPEIFFPETSDVSAQMEIIAEYCKGSDWVCPVIEQCLAADLAIPGPRWGIRGGMTAADRTRAFPQRSTIGRHPRTHCRQGHRYTPENTTTNDQGHRQCVTCQQRANEARAERRVAS